MRKYVASPGAEVIGSAMQNLFISSERQYYIEFVEQVLDQYNVANLENNLWYPHQLTLDIFRLIAESKTNRMNNLVALGVAYVETATFPPTINDIPSALTALSLTYHLNIRNVPPDEGYEVKQLADNHIQIKDLNPFPHDTVYGFIWGIAKRFRTSQEAFPSIRQQFLNPEDHDADGAIYDIIF